MGKGICADCYVGDRDAQIKFARMFGGSGQLPIDIAASLRRPRRRKKKEARAGLKIIYHEAGCLLPNITARLILGGNHEKNFQKNNRGD